MLVRIKKITAKPFKGEDGDMIPYFWYKVERVSDNVSITFGHKTDDLAEVGEEVDMPIERVERSDGKLGYRYDAD